MTKRSIWLIIILLIVFLVMLTSTPQKNDLDVRLESFEEKLSKPNNIKLDIDSEYSKTFLLDIAETIENFMNKIFDYLIGFIKKIVGIFV